MPEPDRKSDHDRINKELEEDKKKAEAERNKKK